MNAHAAMARVLGVVLAGGAGSRVGGADKGLLPLHGRPLIAHVLDALRPQCAAPLIVANRNRKAYARFAQTIHDEGDGPAGPLAGIVAALAHAANADESTHACGWLLTVPVDGPRPPPDLRDRLQSALMAFGEAACAFAHDGRDAQPLFALYRGSHFRSLLASARTSLVSHASVLRWHREIGACAVDFSDRADAFHNLNTPQDFRDYERTHVQA
ncbi:MAG: molybdenum cofactor guanylyltransferase [Proteobacteria bacterium]|nr:molybdenum cofactor guanylyltransferase [Pseudomonadota bacterium]